MTEQVIDTHGETVATDGLPKEAMPLATRDDNIDYAFLRDRGFITPIAAPTQIRQAFAYLQKVYASVLDDRDYLYTVSYSDGGKTKEKTLHTLEDAKLWAEKYKTQFKASPKKSGVTKLAMAFGVEAQRVKVKGLPEQADAHYSYVVYEATHKQTGRKAEGIGWADMSEHNGYMTRHNCVATADTRAFNRAILRLLGFGEVSAEEIISADPSEAPDVDIPDEAVPPKEPAGLPPTTSPDVMEAARAWAEAVAARPMQDRLLPRAQQDDSAARELRGRARIGDSEAAQKLGASGYDWTGPAQVGERSFHVGPSPVDPRSIRKTETKPAETKPQGAPPEQQRAEAPPASPPAASGGGDVAPGPAADQSRNDVTNAQIMELSSKLLAKFADIPDKDKKKEAAQAWLMKTVGVDSTKKLTLKTYSEAMLALKETK